MGSTIRSIAGYLAATAAIVVALAALMGNITLSEGFARLTGITVSPWYTGGAVVKTVDHGTYSASIHRPVFDGLISDRQEGFIQVRWRGRGPWPRTIREEVNIEGKIPVDLVVDFDTADLSARATGTRPVISGIEKTYRLDDGFAVRIALKRTPGEAR